MEPSTYEWGVHLGGTRLLGGLLCLILGLQRLEWSTTSATIALERVERSLLADGLLLLLLLLLLNHLIYLLFVASVDHL